MLGRVPNTQNFPWLRHGKFNSIFGYSNDTGPGPNRCTARVEITVVLIVRGVNNLYYFNLKLCLNYEFDVTRHGNNDQPSLFPAKDLAFWSLANFFQIWVGILLNRVLRDSALFTRILWYSFLPFHLIVLSPQNSNIFPWYSKKRVNFQSPFLKDN